MTDVEKEFYEKAGMKIYRADIKASRNWNGWIALAVLAALGITGVYATLKEETKPNQVHMSEGRTDAPTTQPEHKHGLTGVVVLVIGFLAYFLPCIIAQSRKHKNLSAIVLCNLFFGWTIIGWLITMIWAHTDNTQR